MKVLSILQPWATLSVIGIKTIETRSWKTNYRGPVLIHASARKIPELMLYQSTWEFDAAFYSMGGTMSPTGKNISLIDDLPFGAIIGSVFINDCRPTDSFTVGELDTHINPGSTSYYTQRTLGDYSPGRWGWLMKNARKFPKPIPAKGNLNLWNYEFEGKDASHILQCKTCGYAACTDKFPIDKMNIDTDEESWDTWCPKCEEQELELIYDEFPF